MKKHIYLIGFMGTGKSTISRALHKSLSWDEVDMDAVIEQDAGMKITDIFAQFGESHFRDLETACLAALAKKDASIVSCGGGVVLRKENVDLMKTSGTIVLLTATPETVFERVKHSANRPILNGNMNVEFISQLMEKRRSAYETACQVKIATDGKNPDAIAAEIMTAVDAVL
ncbi:MAG: shikimate kinase [Eubacterium sp.]|nr:shikimate kinase [Eubacterium sp.]